MDATTVRRLAALSALHNEQKRIRDRAEAALDDIKGEIGSLMVAEGLDKTDAEGYPISVVTQTRAILDERLLLENGVDSDVLVKSKRASTSVSVRVGERKP